MTAPAPQSAGFVPTIPRIPSGMRPDAARLYALPEAVDGLNITLDVRRTTTVTLAAGIEQAIAWQATGGLTRTDLWVATDPTRIAIVEKGEWNATLQVRFAGGVAGSGAGFRAARVCKNGTAAANTIGHDQLPGSAQTSGATLTVCCAEPLFRGDWIAVMVSSTTGVVGLHQDYGGTHLSIRRTGPVANAR